MKSKGKKISTTRVLEITAFINSKTQEIKNKTIPLDQIPYVVMMVDLILHITFLQDTFEAVIQEYSQLQLNSYDQIMNKDLIAKINKLLVDGVETEN